MSNAVQPQQKVPELTAAQKAIQRVQQRVVPPTNSQPIVPTQQQSIPQKQPLQRPKIVNQQVQVQQPVQQRQVIPQQAPTQQSGAVPYDYINQPLSEAEMRQFESQLQIPDSDRIDEIEAVQQVQDSNQINQSFPQYNPQPINRNNIQILIIAAVISIIMYIIVQFIL